jgi:hypothetical protein
MHCMRFGGLLGQCCEAPGAAPWNCLQVRTKSFKISGPGRTGSSMLPMQRVLRAAAWPLVRWSSHWHWCAADEGHMVTALALAREAEARNDVPVGAVVTLHDKVFVSKLQSLV